MDASIGEFLRTRRARINPEDVGVPRSLTRRRVAGLRREEVALLAGVSPDYYMRLEQGRTNGVSTQVLNAVARALQLSDTETEHLRNLVHPPRPAGGGRISDADANLRRLVEAMSDVPALLLDQRLDILFWNDTAEAVFAVASMGQRRNAARHLFRDPAAQKLYTNWAAVAADTAAHLRLVIGRNPDDPELTALVGELSIHSIEFRQIWATGDVAEKRAGEIRLDHPVVGPLEFAYEMLTVPARPDRLLATYLAESHSPTDERMRLLLSWSASDTPRADAAGEDVRRGDRS